MTPRAAKGEIESGRRALAGGQWREARRRFAKALERSKTPEALEGLGWALWWLGEAEPSLESRENAYRMYARRGEARPAARVAIGLAVDAFDIQGEAVGSGWLERARRILKDLPPGPEHGWLALWEGHVAREVHRNLALARRRASEAAGIGRRLKLTGLEMLAVALEGLVLVTEGKVGEGMRRLDEATAAALAGEVSDLDAVGQTCCFLIHACERVRDYDRAEQWGQRVAAFCRRWDIQPLHALCRTQYAAMLIGRGAWKQAESELAQASRTLETTRPAQASSALVQIAELRRRQGRLEEAAELLGRAGALPLALLGRAAVALDREDLPAAADLAERFLRQTGEDAWTARACALEILARTRAALAMPDAARSARDELRSLARRVETIPIRALAKQADGLVDGGAGEHAAARQAFEDAVDLFDRSGAPFEAARARLDLAGTLSHLGRAAQAVEEARRAAEAFRGLGARLEAGRAASVLAALGSESKSAPGTRARSLTAREIEVLRLVAEGCSDKRVASRLRLSEHTIHRHIGNILAKLDAPSRAAAVARAARDGIL